MDSPLLAQSGHGADRGQRPLLTQSGHSNRQLPAFVFGDINFDKLAFVAAYLRRQLASAQSVGGREVRGMDSRQCAAMLSDGNRPGKAQRDHCR
jgi:hypothetical protein